MLDYNELYEYLRKEKYGEQLTALPKTFISEVSSFLKEKRAGLVASPDIFADDILKAKKQFENALAIFRELVRIRKRKILNLVFVASETGIMKRDFSTLLDFEQELFENLVTAVDGSDKALQQSLSGSPTPEKNNKMVLMSQSISEFVDMSGSLIGPFEKGALVNLDKRVADILLSEGKAIPVED